MDSKRSHNGGSSIRIEISLQQLTRMIDSKAIAISDIRCLDSSSKQRVWQACLEASLRE